MYDAMTASGTPRRHMLRMMAVWRMLPYSRAKSIWQITGPTDHSTARSMSKRAVDTNSLEVMETLLYTSAATAKARQSASPSPKGPKWASISSPVALAAILRTSHVTQCVVASGSGQTKTHDHRTPNSAAGDPCIVKELLLAEAPPGLETFRLPAGCSARAAESAPGQATSLHLSTNS